MVPSRAGSNPLDRPAWVFKERQTVETYQELIDTPEDIELESIAIRVELDTPLNNLFEVIRQAASELENQGEKSQRIAEQLLRGMAKFCKETGCL